MHRAITQAALAATFATFAWAQNTPTQNQSSSATNSAQGGQSFRGVLMDAKCQAIQSRTSGTGGQAPEASRSRTDASATAQSTGIGGAASATASGAGASGALSNTTNSGGTAATRNPTAGTTGTNHSHEGQATAHSAITPPTEARSTATAATASGATASGASSVTNYSGQTGNAPTNYIKGGAVANQGTGSSAQGSARTGAADATAGLGTGVTTGSDVAGTGDRNRAAADAAGSQWTTAREKYRDCRVTGMTSSFALLSNGTLYMIDDTSGAVRQRMASDTGTAIDWRTVTLMGTANGDRITVNSVQ